MSLASTLQSLGPAIDKSKSTIIPIVTAVGGAAVVMGYMTPDQQQQVVQSLGEIAQGVAQIGKGAGTLMIVGGSALALWRRTKSSLAASVEAHDDMHVTTTDPTVKAKVPAATLADPTQATVVVPVPRPS